MQANGSKYNKTSSMHAKVSNSQINIFPSKSVKSRRLMFCWKFIRIMETFYTNESSSKKKDWFLHPNQQIDSHNTKRNCDCKCILYSILTRKMLLLIPWTRYYSIWEWSCNLPCRQFIKAKWIFYFKMFKQENLKYVFTQWYTMILVLTRGP